MRHVVAVAISAVMGIAAVTGGGISFKSRPPVAHTGGFGEPTCRECHFDGPAPPPNALSLGGVPERYQPGTTYRLEVSILDTTARVGGFELAARIAAGARAGEQAGILCALGARVAVIADTVTGVQYASHSGAAPADSLRWELDWRAPAEDVGTVVFHVAANSANDDDSMLGDVIITGAWEAGGQESGVRKESVGGCR